MNPADLLDRLAGVQVTRRGWVARCPVHPDHRASLSVAEGRDGRVVIHCFAACKTDDVLAALRLPWAALFPSPLPRRPGRHRPRSPLELARARALGAARRQAWARPGVLEWYAVADALRCRFRAVDRARRLACELGLRPDVWGALELAAAVEREALVLETTLDEILGEGRAA